MPESEEGAGEYIRTDLAGPEDGPAGSLTLTRRRVLAGAVSLSGAAAIGLTGCGKGAASAAGNRPRRGGTLLAARIEPTDGFKPDAVTANPSYQADMAVMELRTQAPVAR